MFKQAWFYVTLMAVAAIALLLYGEFSRPRQASGENTVQVAQQPGGGASGSESATPALSEAELVALGEQYYSQLGCSACHSLDGTPLVGPTWQGLYGREVHLSNGETLVADEAYLRESIEDPDARIVQGYPQGVMAATIAPYRSQLSQPGTIEALIAFIKTLE